MLTPNRYLFAIYTTIGDLSSKFDRFLAARSQFDNDHGVDFMRLHVAFRLKIYNTQLQIGDNHLNNHNNNVLAMLLQSCKHKKTKNIYSCRIKYTSTVASKLKSSIS